MTLVPDGPGQAVLAEATLSLHDRPVLVLEPGVHTAPIVRLDVDSAGQFLVTASHDRTVRVWDAANGALLRTLRLPAGPGHVGKAFAAAISPDGALVAIGGWTKGVAGKESVYLYDRASGRLLRQAGGLPGVVFHLAFSPDGGRLAAALGRGGVRLLDPATGAIMAGDVGYGDASHGVAFDPVSGRLATTSWDGKVRLYGPGLEPLVTAPAPGGGRPFGVAFSPDGAWLAVGYADATAVDVLDGRTLARMFVPDTAGVDNGNLSAVTWSADGAALLAAGQWGVAGAGRQARRWPGGGRGGSEDLPLATNTVTGLRGLLGGRLAFAAGDPRVGVLGADGRPAWARGPATADYRDLEGVLAVSADGARVAFGYEPFGCSPAWFSLAERRLAAGSAPAGLVQARTEAPGLRVEGWKNTYEPALNGARLALDAYDMSRSLAVAPDGERFALGTEWSLRLYGRDGQEQWRRVAPGVACAVNVTGDGRLVVAAHGDGTIRWYKLDDGTELLALLPLADRTNWVIWTPEGFYAATTGTHGVLRWHVNRGWDEAPESVPVSEIPGLHRPDVLPLVLQELDVVRALGLAELGKARRAVQERTRSAVAPGAQLHVLAVGVGRYNEERAKHLRLDFAAQDAHDIATALDNTQTSLYAAVRPQRLRNEEATKAGIMDALAAVRAGMATGSGRDLAVIHFSGHGAMIDGRLYLLPYDVDTTTPARIRSSALSANELRGELAELNKLGRVLVLLDACHSGAVAGDGTGVAADAGRLREALATANVTVLTSSSGAEVSREDAAWGNGAFTEALLEALGSAADTDRDGLVGVSELMAYLAHRVPALTGGRQTPGIEARFEVELFAAGL